MTGLAMERRLYPFDNSALHWRSGYIDDKEFNALRAFEFVLVARDEIFFGGPHA